MYVVVEGFFEVVGYCFGGGYVVEGGGDGGEVDVVCVLCFGEFGEFVVVYVVVVD